MCRVLLELVVKRVVPVPFVPILKQANHHEICVDGVVEACSQTCLNVECAREEKILNVH